MVAVPHGVCRWGCTNGKTRLTRLHRHITHKSHRWRWSLQVSTHSVLTWPCGAGGTPGGMPRVLTRWAGLVMGKLHGRENQQIKSYSLLIAVFFTCTPQCNLHCGHRKQQHDTVTTYIHTCVHMLDTVTVMYDVVTTQGTVTAVTSVHTHSTWAASRARPWGQTLWDH